MVREYRRKTQKIKGETIRKALEYMGSHSEREAANLFGVTRSVLQRWKKRNLSEIPEELSQGRFKRVFSDAQENVILQFIFELAEKFYAMTRGSLAELAFTLAEENRLVHKFKDGVAGYDWVVSFLVRHQDKLSVRTGTPLSLIRVQSFTKRNVYRFFDILENIVIEKGYTAETIFNLDETGITVVTRPRKVLAKRGSRCVHILKAEEKGHLVTLTCAANAAGRFIPPMFILPKNSQYIDKDSAPMHSIFFKTAKGWSTSEAFIAYLKHFRKHAAVDMRTQVLLILDGHGSHVSYEAIRYCSTHNIDVVTLPPHTTHKTQPLDVSFFSPLKAKYEDAVGKWLLHHPMRKPRTEDIPSIIRLPYEEAAKETTIINGFSKTGIFLSTTGAPSRYVFADSEFATDPEEEINSSGVHGNDNNDDDDDNDDQRPDDNPQDENLIYEENLPENQDNFSEAEDNFEDSQEIYNNSSTDFSPAQSPPSFPGPSSQITDDNIIYSRPTSPQMPISLPRQSLSLVDYSDSSDEEFSDNIGDEFRLQMDENIIYGSNEAVSPSQNIEAIVVTNAELEEAVDRSTFDVTPWDVLNHSLQDAPNPQSSRKPRARKLSELMTSAENLEKLKERDAKKRKKDGSDSDERRLTRTFTTSQKRKLRSGNLH